MVLDMVMAMDVQTGRQAASSGGGERRPRIE